MFYYQRFNIRFTLPHIVLNWCIIIFKEKIVHTVIIAFSAPFAYLYLLHWLFFPPVGVTQANFSNLSMKIKWDNQFFYHTEGPWLHVKLNPLINLFFRVKTSVFWTFHCLICNSCCTFVCTFDFVNLMGDPKSLKIRPFTLAYKLIILT